MRILLIAGGWSSEREVSLSGARAIRSALESLGHTVHFLDPSDAFHDLLSAAAQCDFAFINMHGAPGEDGLIQAMLDTVPCPYQGSGPAGSILALNKSLAKELYVSAAIPTPDWDFLPVPPGAGWRLKLPYPVFVKPNQGGSSVDMVKAANDAALVQAMAPIFAKGEEVLLETFMAGVELTCAVLGDTALPPILIRPPEDAGFFDYRSKYEPGASEEICPAPVDDQVIETVQSYALKAHRILGLSGCSRSDFILVRDVPYILETNTIPGMTETSLLPLAARTHGLDFPDLIARLIELGLQDRSQ